MSPLLHLFKRLVLGWPARTAARWKVAVGLLNDDLIYLARHGRLRSEKGPKR